MQSPAGAACVTVTALLCRAPHTVWLDLCDDEAVCVAGLAAGAPRTWGKMHHLQHSRPCAVRTLHRSARLRLHQWQNFARKCQSFRVSPTACPVTHVPGHHCR
jgi:hypothetical protein